MTLTLKVGQHVGALRGDLGGGAVLDYSGLVIDVLSPASARVKFSDGAVLRTSTHPDFLISMEPTYALVNEFLRTRDNERVTEAELSEYAGDRLDYFDRTRALWLLHRLAEVIS
ncbi:hypothetical protein [Microbacterium sp.]|uniref:hypothetical protein n=1 Tax=Microbacterium sp. TaxID=51671 RepID=UPI003F95D37E